MRDEVSGARPSTLRPLFRQWSRDGQPLADWTRHLDIDWTWYCPYCQEVVLIVEEKHDNSLQSAWGVTRKLAVHHEHAPWGWCVTCHDDGEFSVVGARNNGKHESFGPRRITEGELLSWIVRVFEQHGRERGHPARNAA
jgi:hypothetical protein